MWDQMYGSAQSSQYWSSAVRKSIHRIVRKCRKWWNKYELDV